MLPSDFKLKYGDKLPPEFELKLRTGYNLPIDYDKNTGLMKGMSIFYRHFAFKGGEVLVFEYYGRFDLNLYILGADCCEIEYPMILHHFQTGNALLRKHLFFMCGLVYSINLLK